ncbi:MAG: GSU2403 family nucleotidyltransferase fold protein [Candidatus Binatia bacterium]
MATPEVSFGADTANARRALLDALEALHEHRDALVLVGAQAVYFYTGDADVPIATQTKDADLAVVPSALRIDPRLEVAMRSARFHQDDEIHQPGEWISHDGYPVELLVPKGLHDGGGRRGARISPHSTRAARVVPGLEAAVVDNEWQTISSLAPADQRTVSVRIASPAALVVAKTYKIGERSETSPNRLIDKDAHDLYRLLRASEAESVAAALRRLRRDPIAGAATNRAVGWLVRLSERPDSLIPSMAGRTERFVGRPDDVAASTWALIQEIAERIGPSP